MILSKFMPRLQNLELVFRKLLWHLLGLEWLSFPHISKLQSHTSDNPHQF